MGEALGTYIMSRWGFANIMIEYLLAIDLLIMTSLLAHISYHCFKLQKDRPQIVDAFNGSRDELFEILTEGGNLLADLCDIVEPVQPRGPVQQAAGNLPELIISSLMNRMQMPNVDGSETGTEQRTIHEEEQPQETQGTD